MNKASINGNSIFFPLLVGPKPLPFLEQRELCGGGCWAGPAHSTGHHLHCVALDMRQGTSSPSQVPRHSPAYCYPGGSVSPHKCWTFIITWSVRLHFICSSCTCHKFQKVTPFPSISDFDDQVVCFIHAVHYCLCVFKNLNISYMQSNMYYVPRTMLEYSPPLRTLTATFEVPCGPLSQRGSLGITGPEILM